ncbi:hypothetical protein Tco_0656886 [Tanacetum coccineum]|uniref:Uncharacterized protein n=1 Tax=Tanacetum coccineum TaxID=301880 RepID=A0ABQ4XA12_9ASTR
MKARMDQTLKPELMDEEFTTTAYPHFFENLKLLTEDQLLVKCHRKKNRKTNAEEEVQSLFRPHIIKTPPLSSNNNHSRILTHEVYTSDSPLPTSIATSSTITTTTTILPPPPLQSTTDPIPVHRIGELEQHIADLIQNNLALEERDLPTVDMKEIIQQWIFEDNTYKTHEVHNDLYEALQKLVKLGYSNQHLADQEEACKKKRKTCESPRTPPGSPPIKPPPPPPPASASGAPSNFRASGSSQFPMPPPSLFIGTSRSAQQQGSQAPSSSKTAASASQSMAWMTSDTQYESADIRRAQELSLTDYLMQDDSIPEEQVLLSDDEDSENDHIPKANLQNDWWKPLPEKERPATPKPAWVIPSSNVSDVENNWATALVSISETPAENSLLVKTGDMTTFMKWYCRQVNKTKLTQADFEGQAYEVVKVLYPDVIHLQFQMEECHTMLTDQIDWTNPEGDQVRVDVNQPLPLGVPLGHVTIQPQFCFNKDLEYLRYGSKGSNHALLISKMKAASYPDVGLELLVPEQMWIDDVCTYDISAKYGISHWWFNRQKFYIDRHDSSLGRKDVRTHMRILSVVRIKAYSRYGYDYLSEIVLRRANFQEHTIAEKDFKNLYPSDFEDLNLLLLQGYLDHLPGSDKWMLSTTVKLWTRNLVIRQQVEDFQLSIESYQTQLNLTRPGYDVIGYEFKHDYTIIESPREVVFPVNNNERKITWFNEIYKFSDGTLTRILEALDYRVKEFKVKRLNLGVNGEENALLLLIGVI